MDQRQPLRPAEGEKFLDRVERLGVAIARQQDATNLGTPIGL